MNSRYRALIWRFVWVIFLGRAALPIGATEVFEARATAIPDGDTLWVQPEDGSAARKLRLQGIDAPEICQSGGVAARDTLVRLVGHQLMLVTVKYYDVYGRGLARIQLDGQDIGAVMVRAGQAWSPGWHRRPGPYSVEESSARQTGVGLFAMAAPELPSDFRKRHGSCYPAR